MGKGENFKWKKWGWIFIFVLTTGFFYIPAVGEKKAVLRELAFRLEEMEKEKHSAMHEKEELLLRIQSQNDPAWIEMVLMHDLGLVPEGWLKVHFETR